MSTKPAGQRTFENERAAFRRIAELPDHVFAEFEGALHSLVYQYSTTNYENRHVTGAAVELLMKCLLELAYMHVDAVGGESKGIDLASSDLRISVKSQFSGFSDLRLRNVMGTGGAEQYSLNNAWSEAMLMLIPGIGLVYGDPESTTLSGGLQWSGDALILKKQAIAQHVREKPQWVRRFNVPKNDRIVRKVASDFIVEALLTDPRFPSLQRALKRKESSASRLGRLTELEQLRLSGTLDDAEYEQLRSETLKD
jgi:hypothetical protein